MIAPSLIVNFGKGITDLLGPVNITKCLQNIFFFDNTRVCHLCIFLEFKNMTPPAEWGRMRI